MRINVLRKISALVLAAFALITLFLTVSIILNLFGIREREGNYVLIVVWANFISGISYLIAAYGFARNKKWTSIVLGVSSAILISAFAGLFIHISSGGIYETKTIGAMIFRITMTIGFGLIAYFSITKSRHLVRAKLKIKN